MTIYWYGQTCFKILTKPEGRGSGNDVTIVTDPFNGSLGIRPPQGKADIITVSQRNPKKNDVLPKGESQLIDLPGEYSIKGVSITGVASFCDNEFGGKHGLNTIFIMESEGIRFCHLGRLGHMLNKDQIELINGVDILAIPIGGDPTIDGKGAKAIVDSIEPKIVIPMHYKIKGLKENVSDERLFCKEIGICPSERIDKLIIRKKDIDDSKIQVILLNTAN